MTNNALRVKIGDLVKAVRPNNFDLKCYNVLIAESWFDLPYFDNQIGIVLEMIVLDSDGYEYANVMWSCPDSPNFLDKRHFWYPVAVLEIIKNKDT